MPVVFSVSPLWHPQGGALLPAAGTGSCAPPGSRAYWVTGKSSCAVAGMRPY